LVLADPDFDRAPPKGAARRPSTPDGAGPPAAPARLPRVPRLPHTAAEAEVIAPHLERLAGVAPRVLTDGRAAEGAFKRARNPRVGVLSTHGFFRDEPEAPPPGGAGPLILERGPRPGRPLENPLLRCGLLLAGCNRRAETRPGQDDGVLTGLEVVGTDLRG